MGRAYNVIDADGHVLEPVDIWDKYIDPAYRERAPKIIVDTDGKERLLVGEQVLGSQKGFGVIGAIGSRDHEMPEDTMKYIDGRKGGFDPHARIPDMDLDGIDAAFLYPSVGLFSGAIKEPKLPRRRVRGFTTAGSRLPPAPTASSAWPCCPCSRSTSPSRRCAMRRRSSGCARLPPSESLQRPDAPPSRLRVF
jgi:hypothetical protein